MSLSAGLAHVDRGGLSFNLIDTPGDSSFLGRRHRLAAGRRDGARGRQQRPRRRGPDRAALGARRRARPRRASSSATCSTASAPTSRVAVDALREAFGPQVVAVEMPDRQRARLQGRRRPAQHEGLHLRGRQGRRRATSRPTSPRPPKTRATSSSTRSPRPTTSSPRSTSWKRRSPRPSSTPPSPRPSPRRSCSRSPPARATHLIGVDRLFDLLALAPSPADAAPRALVARTTPRSSSPATSPSRRSPSCSRPWPTSSAATSTSSASSRARVTSDSNVVVARDGHKERIGQLLKTRARRPSRATASCAGDIGAIAKLKDVVTGDTLAAEGARVTFPAIDFPAPLMSFAIDGQEQGRRGQGHQALRRLSEEDPMIEVHRDDADRRDDRRRHEPGARRGHRASA